MRPQLPFYPRKNSRTLQPLRPGSCRARPRVRRHRHHPPHGKVESRQRCLPRRTETTTRPASKHLRKGIPYAFFSRFPGPEAHGFIFKIRDLHGMLKFRSKCRPKAPFCSMHSGPKGVFDDPHRAGAERLVLGDHRFDGQLVQQVWNGSGPEVKLSTHDLEPLYMERTVPRLRNGGSRACSEGTWSCRHMTGMYHHCTSTTSHQILRERSRQDRAPES